MTGWAGRGERFRALTIVAFAAALAAGFVTVPAAEAIPSTGSIEGKVSIGSNFVARKMRFNLYRDVKRQDPPAERRTENDELSNVVIYLEDAPGQADPGEFVMEQRDSAFVPHVLPLIAGSTVTFPNSDPMFHNVFSLSKAKSFDLGRYSLGKARSVTFDEPGIVKVFCHIHSDMSAVVMALPNPFFAVPGPGGSFRIDSIPAGEYHIVAWHERAGRVEGTVRVEAGRTAVLDFDIPLQEPTHGS